MKLTDSMRFVTEYLCSRELLDDFTQFIESQGFSVKDVQLDKSVIDAYQVPTPSYSLVDTIWG